MRILGREIHSVAGAAIVAALVVVVGVAVAALWWRMSLSSPAGKTQGSLQTSTDESGKKIVDPPGTISKPNGTKVHPDGTVRRPDGSLLRPDGSLEKPDGTIISADGKIIKPSSSPAGSPSTDPKPKFCVDNVLCVKGSHWSTSECSCVPDAAH